MKRRALLLGFGAALAKAANAQSPAFPGSDGYPSHSYDSLVESGKIPEDSLTRNPELDEALNNGGVSQFIGMGIVTYEELDHIQRTNPTTIDALRYANFIEAIKQDTISLCQIRHLGTDQISSLVERGLSPIQMKQTIEAMTGIVHRPGATSMICAPSA